MNVAELLRRLLSLVGGDSSYFVSGSLSFLPLTGLHRQPGHDIDAAVPLGLFRTIPDRLRAGERWHPLRLSEVVIASDAALARLFVPRTAFGHLQTPAGLLDLAGFVTVGSVLMFGLGAGLRLVLPRAALERVQLREWNGISYGAGPPELAFLPKAAWFLRHRTRAAALDPQQLVDLQHLARLVDWSFVADLLSGGGVRWFGRPLPPWLSPFPSSILTLEEDPLLRAA